MGKALRKLLKDALPLLLVQVRRFSFLSNSCLQSLHSSILGLLLVAVFLPRNPKQSEKSSISAESHLGCRAVNDLAGCLAAGREETSQRTEA